ncbi:FixH family protein [Quatrionicoccus australiensis]|uniref:FixH family protein n=1 Tax=Quatrionicoccus australiensis TaxID=138118 RepID=UPI001CFB8C16|nr:FixH family protein [Quatrionicoccus australiensis]
MTLRNDNRPWYKERWPWILMSGPAIVIVAGIATLWLAVISNDGLVTDDYYKQGLAVNQSLKRDHEAGSLGLQADLMRADQNVRLLLNSVGEVNLPAQITLKLAHPTRAGQDQMMEMVAEGQGFYSGKLNADIGGRWLVSIEDPAGQWRLQGDWLADSGEPLRLTAKADK